jgi:hypothetical protein
MMHIMFNQYQAKQVANVRNIGNQQATSSLVLQQKKLQQKKAPVQAYSTRSEDYLDATGFLKLIENPGTKLDDDWPALLEKHN